jgi:hypothetical protein
MANTCNYACLNNTQNGPACDNNCASDCKGNCYTSCRDACEGTNKDGIGNLPEDEWKEKDGDKDPGDAGSNDANNKEVNYNCNTTQ